MTAGSRANTATADADNVGTINVAPATDTETVPTAATPTASLSLSKTATVADTNGNTVTGDAGDVISYSFAVSNTGTLALSNVVVTDPLLPTLSCTVASLAVGATTSCTATGNTYTITAADVTAGSRANTATADADNVGTINVAPATDTETVPTVPLILSLLIDKTAGVPSGNTAGSTIAYTFLVTNTSNVTLTGLLINDAQLDTAAVCSVTTLAPGESTTCTGTHTITQAEVNAGVVNNSATAVGTPPSGPAVISAPDTTTTPIAGAPALTAVKTAVLSSDNATQGVANAGDVITYSVSVTNTGNITLSGLMVTDVFENGAPTTLSCAPSSIDPGATVTCASYTYTVTDADVVAGGSLDNTILARASATVGNVMVTAEATASASIPLDGTASDMQLTKIATPNDVGVGELVRYTVVLENKGVNAVFDATLVDTPPAGFSYVEGSLVVSDRDGEGRLVGTYPIKVDRIDVAVGGRASISYLLRVGAAVTPGVYVNKAYVVDGSASSNTASADVRVVGDPLLDQSLIIGTVFEDRNGNGFQDPASLKDVRIQGGFKAGAYVANSTRIDRGDGAKPEPDASAPLLHGLSLGTLAGRQSEAVPAGSNRIVISQVLRSPDFTDDLVLTADGGVRVTMDADGKTRSTAAESAGKPRIERRVSQIAEGYLVEYTIRNEGIDEHGIPGVRIATVEGVLVETDAYGRFSLQDVSGGTWERGRNFIMKVDNATLPPGSVFTTNNPLVRRVTPGLPVRFDFGVKLPSGLVAGAVQARELEIGEVLFSPGSAEVRPQFVPAVGKMAEQLRANPATEVVISANGESAELAYARAKAVEAVLLEALGPQQAGELKISLRGDGDKGLLLSLGVNPQLGQILFMDDSDAIRPEYMKMIERFAADIDKLAASGMPVVVRITGYTDRRGSEKYNDALGLRRAKSVYQAIAGRLSPDVRNNVRVEIDRSTDGGAGQ